jgi:hypothetical protein
MSVISWGKPKIEVAPFVNGALPETPTWATLPTSKEGSSQLSTTKGNKLEATGEGGELVDVRYSHNSYSFVTELFVKVGDTRPIQDADGVVADNYSVRLTPEDETAEGFVFDKAKVSVEETWSSAEGKLLKYTFDALKPETGGMCKPYTKPVTP